MSDAARWMIAIAFISLPSIAFGGYFLLSILKRQVGTENITSEQRDYFRAGHAHAGVLVLGQESSNLLSHLSTSRLRP